MNNNKLPSALRTSIGDVLPKLVEMTTPRALILPAVLLAASCQAPNAVASSAPAEGGARMTITRAASRSPTKGAAASFTGAVTITPLFSATDHTRASGAEVAFEPGARTAWHSHPAGQTLIITAGTGWVQQWRGQKEELKPGDVVSTPPGVKHWHGATATEGMTHLAIQENVDGKVVSWMEKVSDDQYRE